MWENIPPRLQGSCFVPSSDREIKGYFRLNNIINLLHSKIVNPKMDNSSLWILLIKLTSMIIMFLVVIVTGNVPLRWYPAINSKSTIQAEV